MSNLVGIKKYDYVEFYVGSAKMVAYWYAKAFGMNITGYMGPETGVRDRISYYLTRESLKFVVTSAVQPSTYEVNSFVTRHGDGVKRWALLVENVQEAYNTVIKRGAIPVTSPKELHDDNGTVVEASIKLYDDCEITFVNYDNYNGIFKPGYTEFKTTANLEANDSGLCAIDHIVGNVREQEMDKWAEYFNKVMDFETFVDFGPGDISTQYSALLSKVVRSKDNLIKNPINEPYEGLKISQIEEYIREYHGSGIQHVAITTRNIIKTIGEMRKNGVEFLEVPPAYYANLKEKMSTIPPEKRITEDIDELAKYGILCDWEGGGYLLQLFTKPIGDRPTFFYEIIQRRRGSEGFGQGNFQSLFDSIELDQAKRGNLDRNED